MNKQEMRSHIKIQKKRKINDPLKKSTTYTLGYLQIKTRNNLDSTQVEKSGNFIQIWTMYEKRYSA